MMKFREYKKLDIIIIKDHDEKDYRLHARSRLPDEHGQRGLGGIVGPRRDHGFHRGLLLRYPERW